MRSLTILVVAILSLTVVTACSGSSGLPEDQSVASDEGIASDPDMLSEADEKEIESLINSFWINWMGLNPDGAFALFAENIRQKCSLSDLELYVSRVTRDVSGSASFEARSSGFYWTGPDEATGHYIFGGDRLNADVRREDDGDWVLSTDICAAPPVPTTTVTPDTSYEEELWRLVRLEDPSFSAVEDVGWGDFQLPIVVINDHDAEHKLKVQVSFLAPDHTRYFDWCGFEGDDEALVFPGENHLVCFFYGPDSIGDIRDFKIHRYSIGGYRDPTLDPDEEKHARLEYSSQIAIALVRNEAFPRFTRADFGWFEEHGGVGANADYLGFVGCDVAAIDHYEVLEAAEDGGHDRVEVSVIFSPSCQHHINEPPDTINHLLFEVWVFPDGYTQVWLNDIDFAR